MERTFLSVLVLLALFLCGCDQKLFIRKFLSKENDEFARRFLEALRVDDDATCWPMLDPSLRDEKGLAGLNGVRL